MRLCSRSLLLVIGLTGPALAVCASSPSNIKPEVIAAQQRIDAKQQQDQAARDKARESVLEQQPDVRFDAQSELAGKLPEHEANCYPISHIYLTDFSDNVTAEKNHKPSQFSSALNAIYQEHDLQLPHCLGMQGINILLKRIQNKLIEQGYVTTRVLVQPQDLRTGELELTIIPGKISAIVLQDQSRFPTATAGTLWTAMPMRAGEVLNLRDIEQGLENLKRNPSADADIQIQAAESAVGESDLIVSYKQGFPLHLTLGLDDSGSKATGRLQGTATLSWDNLFSLNDLFYASFNHSLSYDADSVEGAHGSKNMSVHYSVPWQYWLLSLNGSQYHYHQTVAGAFDDIEYAGKSLSLSASLTRLLYRDGQRKTKASFGIWHKKSFNYVDGSEVEVQRRRTAGWELALNHLEYIGQATLQLDLRYRQGTGAADALPAPEELFNEGTSRPKIWRASIDLNVPFVLGEQPMRISTSWQGQWNKTPLILQDQFSIGNRYTVRGFDGELTLSGEKGWVWRNELAWNLFSKGHELYLGIDTGHVWGRDSDLLLGKSLTGGALGLRGNLWGLDYDAFIGRALKKPDGFKTSHIVTGFNVSYRF